MFSPPHRRAPIAWGARLALGAIARVDAPLRAFPFAEGIHPVAAMGCAGDAQTEKRSDLSASVRAIMQRPWEEAVPASPRDQRISRRTRRMARNEPAAAQRLVASRAPPAEPSSRARWRTGEARHSTTGDWRSPPDTAGHWHPRPRNWAVSGKPRWLATQPPPIPR